MSNRDYVTSGQELQQQVHDILFCAGLGSICRSRDCQFVPPCAKHEWQPPSTKCNTINLCYVEEQRFKECLILQHNLAYPYQYNTGISLFSLLSLLFKFIFIVELQYYKYTLFQCANITNVPFSSHWPTSFHPHPFPRPLSHYCLCPFKFFSWSLPSPTSFLWESAVCGMLYFVH